ncbi:MAG TPA: hypothetical protein VGS79_00975 [Puia sp.]|nr:hypothetical protein [Puia sp.]
MNFIATVEDNQRPNIQEIARSLEKVGVKVRDVMRMSGVITGSSRSLSRVRIPGIRSVEQDRSLRAS